MIEAVVSPVTAIAQAGASGRARAVDMVEEALRRIERDDGAINAVIGLRADGGNSSNIVGISISF